MPKEYVAYIGGAFQIEWYYSPKGDSQAFEYYLELDPGNRRKGLQLFKIMGEVGKIHDITNSETKGTRSALSSLSLTVF